MKRSVVYLPTVELFSRMKDAFRYKDSKWDERQTIKFLQEVDYLILDDIGKNRVWVMKSSRAIVGFKKSCIKYLKIGRTQLLQLILRVSTSRDFTSKVSLTE